VLVQAQSWFLLLVLLDPGQGVRHVSEVETAETVEGWWREEEAEVLLRGPAEGF
jgi:hypothetical protein